MPTFESGVKYYITGKHTVYVYFPVNWKGEPDVRCEMCRFYSRTGHSCRLNGEIVHYPERYIGAECPLIFEEHKESEEKE